jgi:hypothetical protein
MTLASSTNIKEEEMTMKPRRKGNIKSRNQKKTKQGKKKQTAKQHGEIEDRCLSLLKLGLSLKSNKVVNNEDR